MKKIIFTPEGNEEVEMTAEEVAEFEARQVAAKQQEDADNQAQADLDAKKAALQASKPEVFAFIEDVINNGWDVVLDK